MTRPAAGLVIYAVDPQRLSDFYAAVTGLAVTETEPGYVSLESPAVQLVLVRVPAEIAATIELTDPPERRETTPLKPLLAVADLEAARQAAVAHGGVVDPAATEWQFQRWRVCDGHDPEGNVFQLRQPVAPAADQRPAAVRPFAPEEFPAFRERSITAFVEALAAAEGRPEAEFRDGAAEQLDRMLPEGLATARTWVLHVLDDAGRDVGLLWLGPHQRRSDALYVNNVEIDPEHRGRGLGRRAMLAAEQIAREAGATAIGLNVFGQNVRARAMYEALGYRLTAAGMTKDLDSDSGADRHG